MAPYTGTMGAYVEALEPGYARIRLADRHRVRNHLDSIHAIALANLGELSSGLALTGALPAGVRGIPVALSITFLKKARGTLTAECRTELPAVTSETEHHVTAVIRNEAGEEVARTVVTWTLGPLPPEPPRA